MTGDRDTNPADWRMPVPTRLIDVAAAAREAFGAEGAAQMFPDMPEHDFRFEVALPGGATISFSRDATAAHIVACLKREGISLDGAV